MKTREMTLGVTGITVPQNAFGVLPLQRVPMDEAVEILNRSYEGGMRFYDTARSYSDSEEKVGKAFSHMRDKVFISTKTGAKNVEDLKKHLDESLKKLNTDYIDIYQFHCAPQCFKPGDGTGLYEYMEDLKRQGVVRHIGITAHKLGVAIEAVNSGLYESLQFPFSYLSGEKEIELVKLCKEKNIGYLCMKALAGGLITDSVLAYAFISQYDNVLPIWGIQKKSELEEWLSYMEDAPQMTDELQAKIDKEREELCGEFCRGCGYCAPCTKGIEINVCARMSLMLRRAPSEVWLDETNQAKMEKAAECINCGVCKPRCPYELDIPSLLKKNVEDYRRVLSGEVSVQ